MQKPGHRSRRVAVVTALSLIAAATGVWSQAVAQSSETIKYTSEALHAQFYDPKTGEEVWIQADELVINSSKQPGGGSVDNAWISADAWNPEGKGSNSFTQTPSASAVSVSAAATQASLTIHDVPTNASVFGNGLNTTASIHATYHTAAQFRDRPFNWTSPDGVVKLHRLNAFGSGSTGGSATVRLRDGTVIVDNVPAANHRDSGVWKSSEVVHVKGP